MSGILSSDPKVQYRTHLVIGFGVLALTGAAFVVALRLLDSDAPSWAEPTLIAAFWTVLTTGSVFVERSRQRSKRAAEKTL